MQIAAAYIRVSTDEQTELSPDSQIKLIRDYAKAHDYIVPDEYIYRDDGISGRKTKNRPAFTQMIGTSKTKPKPFDAIFVWKFSRFARNREDSIVYKSMLKKQGIDVISISEPVGDDKMSILIEAMIEAMDEYYSLNLSEEVSRGMLEKLSRGKCVNSAPIGYYFKDGELLIDEDRANIVRRIFDEYLSGKPMIRIAKDLTDDGIYTKQGKQWQNRTIDYILRNPLYCGKLRYTNGGGGSRNHYHSADLDVVIVQGTHEPIIPQDKWDEVQERIKATKARFPKYARETARQELMLRGILKCSTCGATLTNASGAYQCSKYMHGLCKVSHYINHERIHRKVIYEISNMIPEQMTISPQATTKVSPTKDISKQLQREQVKLERIKDAYTAGIDTLEEYKVNKQKILAEIERLQSQADEEPHQEIDLAKFRAKRKTFLDLAKSPVTSQEVLNKAIKEIVDYIIYDKATETIAIFYRP